ncbi:unnamed protein product [Adineta steineri]|uniref:Retrotransposon gag domain-containing protein n=1 Tax=Adineta steineri TaxID=433720 RepID=A0A814YBV9_9BILA|nr:unnamed protein product [Adineta steineri]CAF4039212.1 unnamed protein product [Adineta steineri]
MAPTNNPQEFLNSLELVEVSDFITDVLARDSYLDLVARHLIWYDNNKALLNLWTSLKANLFERFKPLLSTAKTQLKERQQQPGESFLTYYDDVIDLCKQVDSDMSLHMIIDYLQDGVCAELKIHIKRCMKKLDDDPSPAQFLKIARDEEELQKEFSYSSSSNATATQPYFAHLIATTSPTITHTNHSNNGSRSSTSQSSRRGSVMA